MKPSHNTRWFLLPALLLFGSLLASSTPARAADLSGYWEGRWHSCQTGHNGVLRATFCPIDAYTYRVDFSGRFFKVFPFRYSVVLNVVEQQGDFARLQGSSYLGRMFGMFYYNATVSRGQFNAVYWSAKDSGVFRMTRCSY
jgi:hypothetical protein